MQSTKVLALALSLMLPSTVFANTVTVPAGTRVFIQLDQLVTSKKKHNPPGSFVDAHVWRDVVVDGKTVVTVRTADCLQSDRLRPVRRTGP